MNDLISQIERGEKTVTVGIKNRNKTPQEKNDAAEFLRLARKGQQGDWIPVTPETMPDKGAMVLVLTEGRVACEAIMPMYDGIDGFYLEYTDETISFSKVSHWMPLPALPEQEG